MIELVSIEDFTGSPDELVVPREGDVIEWKLNSLRPETRTGTVRGCWCDDGEFVFCVHNGRFPSWGTLALILSINGQKVGTR